MIANRHPFVVRQERIVGTKEAPDIRRVKDRGVEIGEVADVRRQQQLSLRHWDKHSGCVALLLRSMMSALQSFGPAALPGRVPF